MLNVLYICTHNRCRSILSEAITQQRTSGLVEARSAGCEPTGVVYPLTLQYLRERGYDTDELTSKSIGDTADFHPDVVITVCDDSANEICPKWTEDTIICHWDLADPSKIVGTDEQLQHAFNRCIEQIEQRVDALTQVVFSNHTRADIIQQLSSVGTIINAPSDNKSC